ncbi:excinuclease ABC subunit UvrC [Bartonella sp. TP]|uniref:excinuclease ABC subunit UvrC n=1 Tax=Bartonella sp. TP TaxID=3057550 RepID=UPI0025AF6A2B|nr:excinuclease ABC subunit UvrC [Bartonella sp. TP]WJW80108.1 excinuclease ABC subunit UvrC [Bartonella sp. TP]
MSAQLHGTSCIENFVKLLPNKPGVYRMLGAQGEVLYVGKAKNLKNRVSNYIRQLGQSQRILRMISETCNMEFIITKTETEALLLEANLIKKLKPRYNILLRDDKSFPYIILTKDHKFPGLYKHRGVKARPGDYFGPFANAGAVNRTLISLQKAFLLRSCSDSFFTNRTRPCLLYQIKRCSAPCTDIISPQNYENLVAETKDFLNGKGEKIRLNIVEAMENASKKLDFEQAAIYRDRLTALAHIQSEQNINDPSLAQADLFSLAVKGNMACIEVFFFRLGQNLGNHAYFLKLGEDTSPAKILSQFILQFYDNKPIAKQLLLSHELESSQMVKEALALKAGYNITITLPQRGKKKILIEQAINNASEALARNLANTANQQKLLQELAETFALPHIPRRIEIYDNSHIMGTNAIGAMVVSGPNGFEKDQYRKFNIKSEELTPGDDFAMMQEVLTRRFTRLLKELEANGQQPSDLPYWPDLLIIDGGKGQLSSVIKSLTALNNENINILNHLNIIAIAKTIGRNAGLETFHMANGFSCNLAPNSSLLYFIENLRDEAHRFAVSSHRVRRKKTMMQNPLDEISHIGTARKRALLHHFGSAKAVAGASVKDLTRVEGISLPLAQKIFNHFNE